MKPALALACALLGLVGCGPSSPPPDAPVEAIQDPVPIAPAPYVPSDIDAKAYRAASARLTKLLKVCEDGKMIIGGSAAQGDMQAAYETAVTAKNFCFDASTQLSEKAFWGIANDGVSEKLAEGANRCGLSVFARGQAYGIMAETIDSGGEPRPSQVAEARSKFEDADRYKAECKTAITGAATKLGLG